MLNLGILLILIYGIVQQIFYKKSFGDSPMSDTRLYVFLLFNYFFLILKLKTTIDENGIYYRFPPLKSKLKTIYWSNIKKAYLRKYNPVLEYGGWGIKRGARNVKGNIGLQLQLKNDKKLLIGTQKKDEIE